MGFGLNCSVVMTIATDPIIKAAAKIVREARCSPAKRAQCHCYNRIDIGIGRDLGGIAMPQKINISGEADDGTNQDQINPCPD